MRSVAAALTAVLLLAGDGIQVLAGKCSPPDRCFASLSNDPPGASPFCSSILGYSDGVVVVSSLSTAVVSVTSTVEHTVTATQTAATRTVVRDGTTEFLTSTSWITVSESTTSTINTEELVSSLVVVTSPVLQTSVSVKTVQDTVYEYRSTTTTVIIATITQFVTATINNYILTKTEALSTTTRTQTYIIFDKRDDEQPLRRMEQTSNRPQVPVPTYLTTCRADDISSICERLYPSEPGETVTEYYTPPAVVSNIVVTKTVYATQPQQTQAVTVDGPLVTSIIWVGGTKTVYSTKTVTVTVTQVAPYTSVAAPTELVVVPSTVTGVKTVTTYSPTVVDGRTTYVTFPTTITQPGTLTVFVPMTTVIVRTTLTIS